MITIASQPPLYNPAHNKNVFTITSDIPDLLYFQVKIKEVGADTISNLQVYPTPAFRSGSTIDISKILASNVNTIIKSSGNIIGLTESLLTYEVNVIDYKISGNTITSGSTFTTNDFYVWNGKVNELDYGNYSVGDYLVTSGNTASFLTAKPNYNTNYYSTTEYLHFNNLKSDKVTIKCNYNDGTSATINKLVNALFDTAIVDISPRKLKPESIDLSKLISYEIKALSGTTTLTDVVYRKYNNSCSESITIVWVNKLGGVDSFSFKHATETEQVSKVTATILTDDIYQDDTIVIANNSNSNYSVVSDWLNNETYRWLTTEIMNTKAAYVQLSNGRLLPIKVINSSERIKNTLTSGDMIFNLNFSAVAGLNIPYGDGIGFNVTNDITKVLTTPDFEIVV
ncbi:hypothetical protein [Pedobacter steynii]